MQEKIAVIGLGYVGLPLALALAKKFTHTVGFDIDINRVEGLRTGRDKNGEVSAEELEKSGLMVTSEPNILKSATFFIITAPTPIEPNNCPDLNPLKNASQLVAKYLQKGAVVVYESTVYPGITEDFCGPILAEISGLSQGVDFKLGYSPERINPGDKEHTLEKIVKVVSGEDEATLARVANVYEAIIDVGIYRAPSIKTAEAGKVIENIQRDLNIALMNELALIFDRLGLRTADVLEVAKTKWNFLPFTPGLVGGHCIGVDPYYLTAIAEQTGYHPEVILAGRRINDGMGAYLAQKLIKLLGIHTDIPLNKARVGILGITFKENVRDLRNSRVPDIVSELQQFGIQPLVNDPLAAGEITKKEYNIELVNWEELTELDALILAVTHSYYLQITLSKLLTCLRFPGIFLDVKSAFHPQQMPVNVIYWSL